MDSCSNARSGSWYTLRKKTESIGVTSQLEGGCFAERGGNSDGGLEESRARRGPPHQLAKAEAFKGV